MHGPASRARPCQLRLHSLFVNRREHAAQLLQVRKDEVVIRTRSRLNLVQFVPQDIFPRAHMLIASCYRDPAWSEFVVSDLAVQVTSHLVSILSAPISIEDKLRFWGWRHIPGRDPSLTGKLSWSWSLAGRWNCQLTPFASTRGTPPGKGGPRSKAERCDAQNRGRVTGAQFRTYLQGFDIHSSRGRAALLTGPCNTEGMGQGPPNY